VLIEIDALQASSVIKDYTIKACVMDDARIKSTDIYKIN